MKSPVQPFRPELVRTMKGARESMAAVLLDPVQVKSALNRAAAAGLSSHRFPATVDLRSTPAAKTIVAWCTAEGLLACWSARSPAEADAETVYDLVINWGTAELHA